MTFIIRPCTPSDMAAITDIYAEAVSFGTASFETEPPAKAEMNRRRTALLEGGYPYFVADHDGLAIGYAYAGAYRTRPAYRWTVEDSVYVAPQHQGQGIGKALLRHLVKSCKEAGFRQMIGIVGDSASLGSIKLHEALGFERVGLLQNTGWKHDRWLDSVLMQRTLGLGSAASPETLKPKQG